MIPFKNTYINLPSKFFEKVNPTYFPNPKLIAFNHTLAQELDCSLEDLGEDELAQIFSGQTILEGSTPLAMAYAGFQFGHAVPRLGDGRAHLLGEVGGYDIQLKGSGPTPFSRRGDGKSALGPVLREYLVSEAMHILDIPTTRALAAVSTGETIVRQFGAEPGGVFTRVAQSHIRVGTFQYFAFQQDGEAIKTLLDYTIERHYPQLKSLSSFSQKAIELLKELTKKQAQLIAKWSAIGFIHGVMNTDNFSLAGITIDYGPCAFMDEFSFNKTFSSIDQQSRYTYFNQTQIAQWNILRLADCLLPLISDDQDEAVELVEKELISLFTLFEQKRYESFAQKLGIKVYESSRDDKLIMSFLTYLEEESLDFTLAFRHLPELFHNQEDSQALSFYKKGASLDQFLMNWKSRVFDVDHLNQINPLYIPRNHMIQKSIDLAYQGDYSLFHQMREILNNPFSKQAGCDEFAKAPHKDEKVHNTYCGT